MFKETKLQVNRVELKEMKSLFSFVYEHLNIIIEYSSKGYEFFVQAPSNSVDECLYAIRTQRGERKVYKSFEAMMKDINEALATSISYMKSKSGSVKFDIREAE